MTISHSDSIAEMGKLFPSGDCCGSLLLFHIEETVRSDKLQ